MNAGNRVANRALLFVAGVFLLAAGLAAVIAGIRPAGALPWLLPSLAIADDSLGNVTGWLASSWVPPLLVSFIALAIAIAFIVFACTRGGGRTKEVLRLTGESGGTVVERDVAEQLLGGAMRDRGDVIGARIRSYRVKRAPAIMLVLTARRGAELGRVLSAAHEAIDEWDGLLGARVPVIVHVRDRGALAARRAPSRVR